MYFDFRQSLVKMEVIQRRDGEYYGTNGLEWTARVITALCLIRRDSQCSVMWISSVVHVFCFYRDLERCTQLLPCHIHIYIIYSVSKAVADWCKHFLDGKCEEP